MAYRTNYDNRRRYDDSSDCDTEYSEPDERKKTCLKRNRSVCDLVCDWLNAWTEISHLWPGVWLAGYRNSSVCNLVCDWLISWSEIGQFLTKCVIDWVLDEKYFSVLKGNMFFFWPMVWFDVCWPSVIGWVLDRDCVTEPVRHVFPESLSKSVFPEVVLFICVCCSSYTTSPKSKPILVKRSSSMTGANRPDNGKPPDVRNRVRTNNSTSGTYYTIKYHHHTEWNQKLHIQCLRYPFKFQNF